VRRFLFIVGGIVAAGVVAVVVWVERDRWVLPPAELHAGMRPAPVQSPPDMAPPAAVPTPTPPAAPSPSFDVVRLNPLGNAVIAGRAAPNADVSVRDGEAEIGKTRADSQGEWVIVPDKPLSPGKHDLSIEAHGPDGKVAKSENKVTFDVPETKRAAPEVAAAGTTSPPPAAAPGAVTVQRGGTLWGIARDSLGSGTRFTTIYAANRDHINNPDLIFPGQVVKLPAAR
jgi:nucleoid-associated protein YgaU